MYQKQTVIKGKTITSAFLMAPMVTFGYGVKNGIITDELISHYEARARGGIGMIIAEAACVAEDGRLSQYQTGYMERGSDGGAQNAGVRSTQV